MAKHFTAQQHVYEWFYIELYIICKYIYAHGCYIWASKPVSLRKLFFHALGVYFLVFLLLIRFFPFFLLVPIQLYYRFESRAARRLFCGISMSWCMCVCVSMCSAHAIAELWPEWVFGVYCNKFCENMCAHNRIPISLQKIQKCMPAIDALLLSYSATRKNMVDGSKLIEIESNDFLSHCIDKAQGTKHIHHTFSNR